MSTVTPLRILVCGHVNGNISRLFDRVCSLSKKTIFDALIVTGDLFPADASPASPPVDMSWMQHLIDDDDVYLHLPSSIYVFGPRTEAQKVYYKQLIKATASGETESAGEEDDEKQMTQGFDALNGKITVLGHRGVINCSSGLTIAYFIDTQSPSKEVDQFISTINSSNNSFVDIFLTPVWPKDVHTSSTVTIPEPIVTRSASGSDLISRLVNKLKPRYLFSASDPGPDSDVGVYFERQPYRNHTVLKESHRPVTRFISLACVSADKKAAKWLYAFNIKPAAELLKLDKDTGRNEGRLELNHQPDDTTESPFKGMYLNYETNKNKAAESVQFFYQVRPQSGRGRGGRGMQHNNGNRNDAFNDNRMDRRPQQQHQHDQDHEDRPKRPRTEFDPTTCWFCLASPNVEKEFIVSIGDNAYLATAKGGLVEDHLLILPIEHIRSTLDTTDNDLSDVQKFKDALVKYFDSKGKIVAFYERNFKSQHMQIQVVPLPKECLMESDQGSGDEMLTKAIIAMIRDHGLHYNVIPDGLNLRDVLNPGLPYFHLQIPAINWQVCVNINTRRKNEDGSLFMFPMQLGREILAHILGLDPQLSHWKNVILSKDQEAARAIEFRKLFKDFDFTMMDDD